MTNSIEAGKTIPYPVPSGTVNEGQAILIGQKLGVIFSTNNFTATASAANGDVCTLALEGVFQLPKDTATGSGGGQFAKAYWDPTGNAITANSSVSGAVEIGSFWATCTDAATTCQVKLNVA